MPIVQSPQFPQKTWSKQGKGYVDQWHGTVSEVDALEFFIGSECPFAPSLALDGVRTYPDVSGTRKYIDYTYLPREVVIETTVDTNKPVFTCDIGTLEKPLETHVNSSGVSDYLRKWNYYLAIRNGVSSPAFWGTDNATTDSTANDRGNYQWVKELSEVDTSVIGKNFWFKNKTKPGQESYILPSPVVSATYFYSNKLKANKTLQNVGKLSTPAETYGRVGGAWLIMSGSVRKDGRKYVVDLKYQWADKWDTDLYASV